MSRIGLSSGNRKQEVAAWRVPEGEALVFELSTGDITVAGFGDKSGSQLVVQIGFSALYFQNGLLTVSEIDVTTGTIANLLVNGTVREAGTITPANLTASQNNWAPTGIANVRNVRLSANAGLSVTGISASQTNGRLLRLLNIGSNALTLTHESGSSAAANRFLCPGSANFSLAANAFVDAWYDGGSSRWRLGR